MFARFAMLPAKIIRRIKRRRKGGGWKRPPLTERQILAWADEHFKQTGRWPNVNTGRVRGSLEEYWKGLDNCLRQGTRGLRRGGSLARLLARERGVRNPADLPPLTIKQILAWAGEHHERTGEWPTTDSTDEHLPNGETWIAINETLRVGRRGLPGGDSLARLLDRERGVRNKQDLPAFTIKQVRQVRGQPHVANRLASHAANDDSAMICLHVFTGSLIAVVTAAAAPWQLEDWQERAVVTIARPADDKDCDTAAVKVLCQGHARPDGADYRVLDDQGRPLPFQVMFHDAARYSLLSFRASDPGKTCYIYYGNSQAARAAEEIVADPRPGAGPPIAAWTPRHGLVYATLRRPEGDNPKTVDEFAAMLAASPGKDGARYQRRISDGFNPFGSSDNYLSVYRGWLRVDAAGRYRFCTASNEASFSFLDGKELVHWPGRHTAERGIHGEKNAAIELTAGWHYVEYYHEEVALQQMAFLGWSPPGAPQERFDALPEAAFPAPHQGIATYESRAGGAIRFEPTIVNTLWPQSRHEGQFTRVQFGVYGQTADAENTGDASARTYRWDFGDGQTGTGAEVDHIYLTLGTYRVKLTSETADGPHTAEWPLTVYEVQHVTDLIHEGNLADYARLASSYDRKRLDAAALKELAYLLAEADQPQAALDAASEFVERFAGEQPASASAMRRLMAELSLKLGKAKLDDAIADYLASLTEQTPPEERFDVLARLIRLLGIEQDQPARAGEIFKQAEAAAKLGRLNEAARTAFRECVIAAGDVRLWHAERDEARSLYRRAEALAAQPTAPQVRAAQIGAYPNMIREFIDSGDPGAALNIVDRWERSFPTEKLAGQTLFWRGKLLALRGQSHDAARYLARAVGLAPGAAFESEARWLLASSLKQLGQLEDARRELAKLVAAGFADEFAEKARKELAQAGMDDTM